MLVLKVAMSLLATVATIFLVPTFMRSERRIDTATGSYREQVSGLTRLAAALAWTTIIVVLVVVFAGSRR